MPLPAVEVPAVELSPVLSESWWCNNVSCVGTTLLSLPVLPGSRVQSCGALPCYGSGGVRGGSRPLTPASPPTYRGCPPGERRPPAHTHSPSTMRVGVARGTLQAEGGFEKLV